MRIGHAPDLQNQDNIEISGDFDRDGRVFTVRQIKLTGRIKHLTASSR